MASPFFYIMPFEMCPFVCVVLGYGVVLTELQLIFFFDYRDKRLDRGGLERPDIVFSHNGVTVGCGEIKPFHTSKALIDEDRARLPEFMKRILHERVVGAQTEDEFAVFGFLVSGGEVEISLMRLIDGEYLYKVYTGIVLSSTLGNTDSIAQLLARLYFVRQWITATIPTTVEGPRLFYDRNMLKPTLRLI